MNPDTAPQAHPDDSVPAKRRTELGWPVHIDGSHQPRCNAGCVNGNHRLLSDTEAAHPAWRDLNDLGGP